MTTPNEAFTVLLKELSASASDPIVSPDGGNVTLRGAVKEIYGKTRGWLKLSPDRPRSPKDYDDLFGHVLSIHAEVLINQVIIADLAGRLGTDVKALRAAAIASFS